MKFDAQDSPYKQQLSILLVKFVVSVVAAVAVFYSFAERAQADSYGVRYEQFAKQIRASQQLCGDLSVCHQGGIDSQVLLDPKINIRRDLNTKTIKALRSIAYHQAQVWGDTILEGDYESEGVIRVDQVIGVYSANQLMAYRVLYSERAWYTGDCTPHSVPGDEYSGCIEGRIYEASYVSPDLLTWMRDELYYAEFK